MYEALSAQPGDSAAFIARVGEDINRESCLKIEGFIQSGLFDNKDKFIQSVGLQIVNKILKTDINSIKELSPRQLILLKKELQTSQTDEKFLAKKYIFEIVKTLQNNGYFRDNSKLLDMFVNQVNLYTIDGKPIKAQRQGLLNITTENGDLRLKIPDFKMSTGEIVKPSN